jgi:hypothetical protein
MKMSKSEAGKLGALKSAATIEQLKIQREEEYNNNKSTCSHCNEPLQYEQRHNKFCNSSCSAKSNNRSRKKTGLCLSCGTEIKSKNKYCSVSCQQAKIRKEAIQNNKASSTASKTYLIKLHGEKCMDCGWNKVNPYTNKIPIELEHIDGNSQNNSLENLKLLCPSCHSLTATYKGANKGNGRHKRMERYREGKSF